MDALYELEVAFPQSACAAIARRGSWMDCFATCWWMSRGIRIARSSASTRCIRRRARGCGLGLLELRAFEMAPHVRMGLVTAAAGSRAGVHVLEDSRSKAGWCAGVRRSTTALCCRILSGATFSEVLAQLRAAGYDFEEKWFAAQMEFRFPKIGSIAVEGVELELRQALEPWNVLAEETASGGTVRSVDSSLERIQVKVSGIHDGIPLCGCLQWAPSAAATTGVPGELVAGVRYRARQLSATLHPTVPVHAPLVFDIIDRWKERSIGRCTYHAGPPDGRVYTARPANAAEAEDAAGGAL